MLKDRLAKTWERLTRKYRIVYYDDESLNQVRTTRTSRLRTGLFYAFLVLLVTSAVALIIFFTPIIRQQIPGYMRPELEESYNATLSKVSELEKIIEEQQAMLSSFSRVAGVEIGDSAQQPWDASLPDMAEVRYAPAEQDSMIKVTPEQVQEISRRVMAAQAEAPALNLMSPVDGIITKGFIPGEKHYGIDIAADDNSFIRAASDGVVIFSEYSYTTGWVIGISHMRHKAISFYKHNSRLFKNVGDYVFAGEAIAVIGNTGSLQSGTHLHFELWLDNIPVNPEDFVLFN